MYSISTEMTEIHHNNFCIHSIWSFQRNAILFPFCTKFIWNSIKFLLCQRNIKMNGIKFPLQLITTWTLAWNGSFGRCNVLSSCETEVLFINLKYAQFKMELHKRFVRSVSQRKIHCTKFRGKTWVVAGNAGDSQSPEDGKYPRKVDWWMLF